MYLAFLGSVVTTVSPPPREGVRVRQANTGDLLDVHRIEQSAFPQPWPFAAFEQYVGQPGFLVADGGAVIGYVVADTVAGYGRQIGHIKDLAVRRDRRREGIASTLLTRAIAVLESQPITAVKLEVRESNEAAQELYRRHGFAYRRTLGNYYADGEDGLVLVRGV